MRVGTGGVDRARNARFFGDGVRVVTSRLHVVPASWVAVSN